MLYLTFIQTFNITFDVFRLNDVQEQGYGSTALQKQIESLSEAVNTIFNEILI